MPILTPAELAGLQTDLAALLPDACSITRHTKTEDAYGGEASAPTVIATGVPVMVNAIRVLHVAGDVFVAPTTGMVEEAGRYQVTLPHGTDIQMGDTIVITTLNNLTMRVTALVVSESLSVVQQAGAQLVENQ
jgi:hypothetical protein